MPYPSTTDPVWRFLGRLDFAPVPCHDALSCPPFPLRDIPLC